jgi:hypothetical protein
MNRAMTAFSAAAVAIAAAAPPAHAEDREMQAILDKAMCVPARISRTEHGPTVTSYEVTCMGGGKVVHILCLEDNCQRQVPAKESDQ